MAQISLHRPWVADSRREFDRLRQEMDALFGRLSSASPLASGARGVFPAVNLYETADAYMLAAELPGVGSDDIDVSIEATTVTLRGERKIEHPDAEDASFHRRERRAGAFRRAFQLPGAIEADKAEAIHRNGVLMLRLPKTPESQPRRIPVRAN